ncbi:MAG: ribonuclease HII, partial [Betaproteobacteria bacterium]|nr:ribonuclease HII [Betaproteobacteria bacterium]
MQICGVDDAGRGSMLGPLVIAGVSLKKSDVSKLKLLGVKDSKQLTPKLREELYKKI